MPTELPKNIIKLIVALLKHQAENVLGKEAIGIAGQTIVEIGGEKIQGKIDAIINTNEGATILKDAALRADAYFKAKCTDHDLLGVFTMPFGDLMSVQATLRELPNALDQEEALETLHAIITSSAPNLTQEQIEYGATLYLDCLNRALLPLKDFTLPIIGQTVLESKADIKEIKTKVDEVLQLVSPAPIAISEIQPPLPEFDPTILDNLDAPGGALKISDPFYIERDGDGVIKRHIIKNGSTIIIRASHQTGKSSLLARGLHHASLVASIVNINLQSFEARELENADSFYRHIARVIIKKLKIDSRVLNKTWQEDISSLSKLNDLMEDHILNEINHQVIIAIDEADRLIHAPFRNDFFGLMRTWHNNRAIDHLWNKLNLVLVISTEPNALISSLHQSPFNVGLNINLDDFSYEQVYHLNKLHGEPVRNAQFDVFFELLNGHPFLIRHALYLLINKHWTFHNLIEDAAQDNGPFSEHLKSQFEVLSSDQQLQRSFAGIIQQTRYDTKDATSRLLQLGLIKGRGESYYCRCGLYKQYFMDRFR